MLSRPEIPPQRKAGGGDAACSGPVRYRLSLKMDYTTFAKSRRLKLASFKDFRGINTKKCSEVCNLTYLLYVTSRTFCAFCAKLEKRTFVV